MNKTFKPNTDMWELHTDAAHILHRIGSEDYTEIRTIMVKANDVENYEEVALADIPPYTKAEYDKKVAELIHARYDADKEMSLINNMMEAEPTEVHKAEYNAYQAYRAECKQKAKDPALYANDADATEARLAAMAKEAEEEAGEE